MKRYKILFSIYTTNYLVCHDVNTNINGNGNTVINNNSESKTTCLCVCPDKSEIDYDSAMYDEDGDLVLTNSTDCIFSDDSGNDGNNAIITFGPQKTLSEKAKGRLAILKNITHDDYTEYNDKSLQKGDDNKITLYHARFDMSPSDIFYIFKYKDQDYFLEEKEEIYYLPLWGKDSKKKNAYIKMVPISKLEDGKIISLDQIFNDAIKDAIPLDKLRAKYRYFKNKDNKTMYIVKHEEKDGNNISLGNLNISINFNEFSQFFNNVNNNIQCTKKRELGSNKKK